MYTTLYKFTHIVDSYCFAISGKWQKDKWTNLDGDDRANKGLWQEFIREYKKTRKRIEIRKTKAHSNVEGNEMADRLAKQSRRYAIMPDYDNKGGVRRKWLDISERKNHQINVRNNFIIYIQRTKPKTNFFEACFQILRPKKYFGAKNKARGVLGKHNPHVGHIHKIKFSMDEYDNLLIENIIEDIGRPSDNQSLWKIN